MANIVKLACYGTLKAGHGNHRLLEDAVTRAYPARVGGFTLYGHGIPYAVPARSTSDVHVEVFHLSDPDGAVLARLDRLEGHPVHYRRTRVRAVDVRGEVEEVWMYVRAGGAANIGSAPHIGSFWPPAPAES